MKIDRLSGVSPDAFERDYMRANRPLVVTDALTGWGLPEFWTPAYLLRHFAEEKVQVYNSYFDFKSIRKLGAYLADRFGRSEPQANPPYVRWYTKLRNVEFFWADAAFAKMALNWSAPYFMPRTDYVLPFSPAPRTVDPTVDLFPAKGLFISERGARTGLHVDPWGSDAVLCQLYGTKTWAMYAPDQAPYLESNGSVVDTDNPDLGKFPHYARAQASYEFVLEAGDVVYVPHGWYHTARSDSDSISLTWNFVHRAGLGPFRDWLAKARSKLDDDVIRFFFAPALGTEATSAAVVFLLAEHFGP
jgi:hypothetical protein